MSVEKFRREVGKLKSSSRIQSVGDEIRKSRLLVSDKKTGLRFLVDTGADLSVLPRSLGNKNRMPADLKLFAANNTPINTYGEKLVTLDIGLRRPLSWAFTIADVAQPIIGADFLARYGLLVDLRGRKIVDSVTSLSAIAISTDEPAQGVSTIASGSEYQSLLKEFVDITIPSRNKGVQKQGVYHHIITEGPPVAQRARRLSPEKLKEARTEFDFMLAQGICQPSDSSWAR